MQKTQPAHTNPQTKTKTCWKTGSTIFGVPILRLDLDTPELQNLQFGYWLGRPVSVGRKAIVTVAILKYPWGMVRRTKCFHEVTHE